MFPSQTVVFLAQQWFPSPVVVSWTQWWLLDSVVGTPFVVEKHRLWSDTVCKKKHLFVKNVISDTLPLPNTRVNAVLTKLTILDSVVVFVNTGLIGGFCHFRLVGGFPRESRVRAVILSDKIDNFREKHHILVIFSHFD